MRRELNEVVQDFDYATAELHTLGMRIDYLVRQYPTVGAKYQPYFMEARELLTDVLLRLERKWDQTPIKVE